MAIRGVLFDFGNVLVRWDPRNLYRTMFADPAEMERFLSTICTLDWHARFDAGELFAPHVDDLAAKHPGYEPHIRAWESRFGDMLDGEITGVLALVDKLSDRGVPMGLLTNMPAEKRDECFSRLSRMDAFGAVVVSGEEKLTKPDARIFALAADRMGLDAGDVLFIDDVAKNVVGAERAGMKAHLFETPAGLEAALTAEGLLG